MMKLLVTNSLFNKEAYVECLRMMGVEAYPTMLGVMLDVDAYKANYRPAFVPHLVYMNHKWVKELY